MKKKFIILLLALMMLLTACGSGKTVKTKEEVQQLAEEFYECLKTADKFTMSSYNGDQLTSVFAKDGDKYYVNYPDSYDYYCFIENGTKYVISDDGSLSESEATYDMTDETINMLLQIYVFFYLDVDSDNVSFTATSKDNELVINVKTEYEGDKFETTITGKKENGNIIDILTESKYDDTLLAGEYKFEYGTSVELPEYTVPKTYNNLPHVESPYKTYGEIIETLDEDESLFHSFFDDELVVIAEKDGRYYQFSSIVSNEVLEAYNSLDFFDENYDQNILDLLADIEIEDCIDFTDELLSQEQLNGYVGKTIGNLVADGFEINGYSLGDEDGVIFAYKDSMDYSISVIVPEGFDAYGEFEYDAFNDFVVDDITFDSVGYDVLPLK